MSGHRGLDDRAGERRLPTARAADKLCESAARQPSAEQRGVERHDARGKRGGGRCGGREEPHQLGEGERQQGSGEE